MFGHSLDILRFMCHVIVKISSNFVIWFCVFVVMAVLEDPDVLFTCVSTLLIILTSVQDIVFNTIQLLGIAPFFLCVPMEIEDVSIMYMLSIMQVFCVTFLPIYQ